MGFLDILRVGGWRARWDLNPRSPAPQASVLILTSRNLTGILGNSPNPDTVTRLRARTSGIRYEDKIINSLLQMKNKGLYDNTLKTISQKLNQLSRNSDLMKPSEVLTYIANLNVTNSTKQKLETTMHYVRAITITGEEEYTCKAARTQQEIIALAEAGFTKFDEIDGIHLYRKRK
jgi:hypothetical protein